MSNNTNDAQSLRSLHTHGSNLNLIGRATCIACKNMTRFRYMTHANGHRLILYMHHDYPTVTYNGSSMHLEKMAAESTAVRVTNNGTIPRYRDRICKRMGDSFTTTSLWPCLASAFSASGPVSPLGSFDSIMAWMESATDIPPEAAAGAFPFSAPFWLLELVIYSMVACLLFAFFSIL